MYIPSITKNSDGSFYALVVRLELDGERVVVNHYKGRHFKTEKAAIKSTTVYITKSMED